MRRTLVVAFAVFACYLVVSTAPVAASHGQLAVGSSHSTADDFNNGTLSHATVTGSGEGSSVEFGVDPSFGFEGEPADAGVPDGWEQWGGSIADQAVTTERASSGSQSYYLNASDSQTAFVRPDYQPLPPSTKNVSFDVFTGLEAGVQLRSSESVITLVSVVNGGLKVSTASGYNTVDTGPGANEWVHIEIYDIDPSTDTFSIYWENPTDSGTVTELEANAPFSSGWSSTRFRVWSGDGYLDNFQIGESDLATIPDTGRYISQNHSVSNAVEGWTDLTLENATATVEWQAWTGTQWQVVNSSQYSATGNYTLDIGTDYPKWRVDVHFEKTGANPTAQLHDEGILVETDAPEVDDSSLSPNSTDISTGESVTLSADVSDSDFGTSYDDSATIYWYVDGEQVGTDSISSNGTVEYTLSNMEAGEHDWHVEVADSYGHRTTSDTAKFATPAELRIYNESDPTSLVDGPNETVELRFFFDERQDDLVVERQVSDGTINMTGLPVDEPFIIVADAADYRPRRIWVPSLYETQRVYLLPDSEPFVSPKFTLNDFSGRFPPGDTVLLIQRPLNGSWRTVQADYFGATNEVPAQLRHAVRHRLVLLNTQTGERSRRGQYTPLNSNEKVVEVKESGDVTIQGLEPVVELSPTVGTLPATNDSAVSVRVFNQSLDLSEWTVTVRYEGNGTNETLAEVTRSGPAGGSVSPALNLSNRAGGSVKIVVTWTTDGGETGRETFARRVQQPFSNDYSLISVLGNVNALVPEQNVGVFQTMVAIIVSVLVAVTTAAKFRASTEAVGLAAVGTVAGFTLISWVPASMLFASGVTMTAFAAYRRGL